MPRRSSANRSRPSAAAATTAAIKPPDIRVLVADDEEIMRDALVELIELTPGMMPVAVASSAEEASAAAEAHRPDVALVDVRMPGGGITATREILRRSPLTRVLALSASGSSETVREMLRAGAAGYLVKGGIPSEVIAGIRHLVSTSSPISAEVVQDLEAPGPSDPTQDQRPVRPGETDSLKDELALPVSGVSDRSGNPKPLIRVLIVDDHTMVREGLQALLAIHDDMVVVGVAGDAEEAVKWAIREAPDVVMMDFRLGGRTGAEAAAEIRAATPGTAVVFLSADESEATLIAAVKAGAAGYLAKTAPLREVVSAIRRAAAGEMLIPARVLAALLTTESSRAGDTTGGPYGSTLTGRELEILQLTAEGVDSFGIAERLFIELTTVRWHVRNILEKLSAHSKLEAVARAAEHGLVHRPVAPLIDEGPTNRAG